MTEQELRALVRDAVARRLAVPQAPRPTLITSDSHPSHGIYLTLVNTGGECVIEPNVTCTHCNYCKSHGH